MSNPTALGRLAKASALAVAMLPGMVSLPAHAEMPTLSGELASARENLAAAWSHAALSFTVATFTDGKAEGYGRYTPKAEPVFAPNETMQVYAEPVAYGFGSVDGLVTVDLAASFELRTTSGQVLASGNEFAHLTAQARHPIREFPATLTYRFDGLSPGDYVLVTRLVDANSDKSGAFSLPFTVKAP